MKNYTLRRVTKMSQLNKFNKSMKQFSSQRLHKRGISRFNKYMILLKMHHPEQFKKELALYFNGNVSHTYNAKYYSTYNAKYYSTYNKDLEQINYNDNLEGFSNINAYKYNHRRYKPFTVYIHIDQLKDPNFHWIPLRKVLRKNERYYIMTRIYFVIDPSKAMQLNPRAQLSKHDDQFYDYKGVEKHISFLYNSDRILNDKLDTIIAQVDALTDDYLIEDDQVRYVLISIRRLDSKLVSDIEVDDKYLNENNKRLHKQMVTKLPLTIDDSVLGGHEKEVTSINGKVNSIIIDQDGNKFDFMDRIRYINKGEVLINKDPIEFDSNSKFYVRGKDLLAITKLDAGKVKKSVHRLSTGDLIQSAIDKVKNKDIISREIFSKELTITAKDNKVILEAKNLNFKTIDATDFIRKRRFNKSTEYTDFGVIDLETYHNQVEKDLNKSACVYAAGIYVQDLVSKVFYIDKDLNSHQVVMNVIEVMFEKEFDGYD